MSLAELKEAVVALSLEERHQLRDVLDALEEGVTVDQLHEIDLILDEAINDKSSSIPAEKVWAEMDEMLKTLTKKNGQA